MKVTTIGYWGAYPEKNEATSCYLVQTDHQNILLDCGSGALAQLQNYLDLTSLDAVFISHVHTDHIADMYSLEYAMLIQSQLGNRTRPLEVYIYGEHVDELPFEFPQYVHIHSIRLEEKIEMGELTFSFSENVHEVPCVAIKVEDTEGKKLVYSADTGMTDRLKSFAKAVDLLIIECSFFEQQKGMVKGHLSTVEVAEIVNAAQPQAVVLTHFPHFGDRQQLVREVEKYTAAMIYLAGEGFTFTI